MERTRIVNKRYAEWIVNRKFAQRIVNRKFAQRIVNKKSAERIVNTRSSERVRNKKSAERIINKRCAEGIVTEGSASTPPLADTFTEGSMSIPEASSPPEDIITEIGLPTYQMDGNKRCAVEGTANASSPPIEDIITEDGILCSILSNLTLREAVQTCALSPRWRHIWTHVPKLYFGAKNMFDDHTKRLLYDDDTPLAKDEIVQLMQRKTYPFICYVDSFLHQRQLQGCLRVDEFVVRYCLHKIHSPYVDAWVNFAVSSKTKVLAFYLQKPIYLLDNKEKYDFPCHLLGPSSSVEVLILRCCSLKPTCKFNGLNRLKKLQLYCIDVTEEDINHLLTNCYTLEFIKLFALPQLVTLTIAHPLSQLETFIVNICKQLRGKIKIHAKNLTNLVYYGYPVDFNFSQSSRLLAADITFKGELWEPNMDFYVNKLSLNLPQLQKLTCTIIADSKVPALPEESRKFIHMRHLDWSWEVSVTKMSLHHLATLLDAAPFLEVLNLHLSGACRIEKEKAPKRLEKLRQTLPRHPHNHLKIVQFKLFSWDKCHVEFLLYFLKNAIELQWIKIMEKLDEKTTEKLRQELPAQVKLKILADP